MGEEVVCANVSGDTSRHLQRSGMAMEAQLTGDTQQPLVRPPPPGALAEGGLGILMSEEGGTRPFRLPRVRLSVTARAPSVSTHLSAAGLGIKVREMFWFCFPVLQDRTASCWNRPYLLIFALSARGLLRT